MQMRRQRLPGENDPSWKQGIKVLVSGPFATGKTQFIATASEVEPLQTEVTTFQEIESLKASTTVALDFGRLVLASGQTVFLFGTPGQPRFEFMWDILSHGMQGLLFLVDATAQAHLDEARGMLDYFRKRHQVPIVVCANKQDLPGAQSPATLRVALQLPDSIPFLPLCAMEKASTHQAIEVLVHQINYVPLQTTGHDGGIE